MIHVLCIGCFFLGLMKWKSGCVFYFVLFFFNGEKGRFFSEKVIFFVFFKFLVCLFLFAEGESVRRVSIADIGHSQDHW